MKMSLPVRSFLLFRPQRLIFTKCSGSLQYIWSEQMSRSLIKNSTQTATSRCFDFRISNGLSLFRFRFLFTSVTSCCGPDRTSHVVEVSSLLSLYYLRSSYILRYFGDHGHVSQRSIRFKVLNCTHAKKRSKAMNRHKFT